MVRDSSNDSNPRDRSIEDQMKDFGGRLGLPDHLNSHKKPITNYGEYNSQERRSKADSKEEEEQQSYISYKSDFKDTRYRNARFNHRPNPQNNTRDHIAIDR